MGSVHFTSEPVHPLMKWLDGGFQEFNKRGGLENIPGAVGFGRAVELVTNAENTMIQDMRDHLIERVSI